MSWLQNMDEAMLATALKASADELETELSDFTELAMDDDFDGD